MFNAFKFTKQLEDAGFSREQAEIQVQVITEIIEEDLATKQDLKVLETNLGSRTNELETNLASKNKELEINFGSKLKEFETNFASKLKELEYKMVLKVGGLFVLGFTTMLTILKFWVIK
jgi:hypothetical protein